MENKDKKIQNSQTMSYTFTLTDSVQSYIVSRCLKVSPYRVNQMDIVPPSSFSPQKLRTIVYIQHSKSLPWPIKKTNPIPTLKRKIIKRKKKGKTTIAYIGQSMQFQRIRRIFIS